MKKDNNGRVGIREVFEIVTRLETKMDTKFDELDDKFVTKVEFWPVRSIVYGGVGIILIAVVGTLIAMVVK